MNQTDIANDLQRLTETLPEAIEAEHATSKAASRRILAEILSSEFPNWDKNDLSTLIGMIGLKLGYPTTIGRSGGFLPKPTQGNPEGECLTVATNED